MILVVTLVVVALAFGVRVLLQRYNGISAANAAPVALIVAFAFGYTVAPHTNHADQAVAGAPELGSATLAASPAAAGSTSTAFAAATKHNALSPSALADLEIAPGITPGYVDGFLVGSSTTLDKSPKVDRGAKLRISGWIVSPAKQPASAVVAIVDGKTRIDVTKGYGGHRPDVATYLGNENAVNVGFDASLPTAHLTPGTHRVVIGAVADDGRSTSVLQPVTFDVR